MIFFIGLRKLSAHIYAAKKVNKYKMRNIRSQILFIFDNHNQQYRCACAEIIRKMQKSISIESNKKMKEVRSFETDR